jgi:hypothetical protein
MALVELSAVQSSGIAQSSTIRLATVTIAFVMMFGCTASEPAIAPDDRGDAAVPASDSSTYVADPRQYVRDALMKTENALGRTEYHLRDETVLDEAIDTAMKRKRRDWTALPNDQEQLDRFIPSAARTWRVAQFETAERRQQIEDQIEAYFQAPMVETEGETAIVYLGILPGQFQPTRSSWDIRESEYADNSELKPEQVRRAFQLAYEQVPQAKDYRVLATIPYGSGRRQIEYLYDGDRDRLKLFHSAKVFQSRSPIGGIEALIDGRASTRLEDLETPRTEIPKGPWGEDL